MNSERALKAAGIFLFDLLFFSCSYLFCTNPLFVFLYCLIVFLCTWEILRNSKYSIPYAIYFTAMAFVVVNILFFLVRDIPIKSAYASFDRIIMVRLAMFISVRGFTLLCLFWLSTLLGTGIILVFKERQNHLRTLSLLCLTGLFLVTALTYDPYPVEIVKTIPPKDICNHDTLKFTRMFYLMKEGKDYYYSLGTETMDLSKITKTDIIYWRPPTLFTFWSWVLPANALYIIYLYLFLSTIAAFLGYKLLEDLAGFPLSLLGVQLLFAFYLKGIMCLWYNNFEIWGGFFVIIALYFVVKKKHATALAFFLAAFFIRELYVITLLLYMVYLYQSGKKRVLAFSLAGLLGYAVFYIVHFHHMHQFFQARGIPLGWSVSGRVQHMDFMFFLQTLQFGSSFIVGHFWMTSVIYLLSLAGIARLRKDTYTRLFLTGVVTVPFILFLFFGAFYNDYWGGVYLPAAFLLAPSGLNLLIRGWEDTRKIDTGLVK